jgi:hypothetical protein
MIDNFAILVTTIAVLIIMVRAAKLDRTQPWFVVRSISRKAAGTRPGRRRAGESVSGTEPEDLAPLPPVQRPGRR